MRSCPIGVAFEAHTAIRKLVSSRIEPNLGALPTGEEGKKFQESEILEVSTLLLAKALPASGIYIPIKPEYT